MPGHPIYVTYAEAFYLWTGEEYGGDDPCCEDCGECPPGVWLYSAFSSDPVRYSNGEVKLAATDLASNAFGVKWGHTRSYSNQLTDQVGGANGNSWRVAQWPYLSEVSPTSICVVVGTIYDAVWFDLVNGSYVPRFSMLITLMHDTVSQQYVYTDRQGFITKFFDYNPNIPQALQGQFKSLTSLNGVETCPSYDPKTNQIMSFVLQAEGASTGYYYVYYSDGDNAGQLQFVTLMVNGLEVRQANYSYYQADEKFGNLNDLKKATIQQLTEGEWIDLDVAYYRYYKPDEPNGIVHGLRYMLGPQSYARMLEDGIEPETATNAEIAARADNAFQYDPITQAATLEKTMASKKKFRFFRTNSDFAQGFNNWSVKTVETLPDDNSNIVYTNFRGQVILSIRQAGEDQWFRYNQYNDTGLVILAANSSAVQGFDEKLPGLVRWTPKVGQGGIVKVRNPNEPIPCPKNAVCIVPS